MSGRSPGVKGGAGPPGQRCLVLLQHCLAIQLHKVATSAGAQPPPPAQPAAPSEYWMYDSGYLLFQGLLEANLKCFWNASLLEAMKLLQFQGYVSPGVLLVTASACVLEVVRAAWARNVLKPPNNYVIAVVGDMEDCLVQPLPQGQFTPLPEALCWVILDLTSAGQPAVLDKIRTTLSASFPAMESPSSEVVYDALAKLMADRKVYQTSQGYFVVTPERRRRDSASRRPGRAGGESGLESRALLMSAEEALALVHGEMATIRDGDVTHQAVQTNLADVICGGNPNDKVVFARSPKRSSSFPAGRLERRHSLRLFGSSKRLSVAPPGRSGSLRHIDKHHSESSSSTECHSTDSNPSPKKSSLLSRLFRRSKRGSSVPPLSTFSAQFPPVEWFNQRVVHMHSVATQTCTADAAGSVNGGGGGSLTRSQVSFATWTDEDGFPSRSATLPRRHRRHNSGSGSSLATGAPGGGGSTPRTPRRHRSPSSRSSSLPQSSSHSHSHSHSLSTSRTSVLPLPTLVPSGSNFSPCKSSATTLSSEPSQSSGRIAHADFDHPSCGSFKPSPGTNGYHSSPGRDRTPSQRLSNGYHVPSYVGESTNSVNDPKSSPGRYSDSSLKQTLLPPGGNGKTPLVSASVAKGPGFRPHPSPERNGGGFARSSLRSSLGKGKGSAPLGKATRALSSPPNKSSITLQVSTTNRSSPTLTSGYSSQCPSTNGDPAVDSPPNRGFTLSSPTPILSTTTTTTIDGSNTKIFVQQQNSPVRSLITFENGLAKNGPEDILIINEPAEREVVLQHNRKNEEAKRHRPKAERPTSLYSPREATAKPGNTDAKGRCPSVETLTVTGPEVGRALGKRVNMAGRAEGLNLHPNVQPPSTPTCSETNMNNTRKLSNSGLALHSPSPLIGRDGLSYKNVFGNPSSEGCNPFGSKNNVTSPDKTFDSTGSFNNLFIQNQAESENKLSTQNGHNFSSTKTLDDLKDADLCTFPSLGDLSVNFKSLAAQKILKGISINSIDTLVEVNMAAAEKQNNCDVTVHTDFGVV